MGVLAWIIGGIEKSCKGNAQGNYYRGFNSNTSICSGDYSYVSIEDIVASVTPASDVATIIFGNGGAAFITAGIVISGTFDALTNLLVFVLWIFFVMGVFGVFTGKHYYILTFKFYNRNCHYPCRTSCVLLFEEERYYVTIKIIHKRVYYYEKI